MRDMTIRTRGHIISYAADEQFSIRDVEIKNKVKADIPAGTVVVVTEEGEVETFVKATHTGKTPLLVVERAEVGDSFIVVANKGCYINPAYVDKDGLAAVIAASNGDLRVAQ
ncbi:hypothetical protein RX554_004977 [Escherichia coli]|nr:hypothetical protein [Escherichia coli]ELL1066910.1 hypothetical protein [Escherichia coli]ELL9955706.1 hypothetical protein [Escherichia coli]ELL9988517.1 hypothetical protein [Escherichia coli]ELN0151010.1 hypothetical protein [Escherichia coli]